VVLEQLLASLRNGKLRPGSRLPSEVALCGMLGVGRSSVREALRVLAFIGLVESRPGRGAVVRGGESPIPATGAAYAAQSAVMRDLYEVRAILEGGAAARAAARASEADLAAIERAARGVEIRIAGGRSYFRENVAFHVAVVQAAHNHVLAESVQRLLSQLTEFRQQVTDPVPGLPARDVREHRQIVAAIRARQDRRAQALMERHIRSAVRKASLDAGTGRPVRGAPRGRRARPAAAPRWGRRRDNPC
jgi:GntR family transcriptional repressor for pyruvate dehydrogenase complex